MIPPLAVVLPGNRGKPRASGDDPAQKAAKEVEGRVNPARAGMIHRYTPYTQISSSKPRASGDDPVLDLIRLVADM